MTPTPVLRGVVLSQAQTARLSYAVAFTREYTAECGVPMRERGAIADAVESELADAFARGEQYPNSATETLWRERALRHEMWRTGDALTA